MLDNKIGYIICESTGEPTKANILAEKNNRVTIEARLQKANELNRNKRFYDDKELFPALKSERLTSLLEKRALFGEAGHPVDSNLARQQILQMDNLSHRIEKIWTSGDDVMGIITPTPTQRGNDFNNFILDNTIVEFSLRALGSVTNTKRGAEVRNINIITWDWVLYASHPTATLTKILSESTDNTNNIWTPSQKPMFTPITNKQVMNYIKTESANINTVLKSFDTLYESASLIDNGSRVQLCTSTGDILVINLESYIQNEIMDFCNR